MSEPESNQKRTREAAEQKGNQLLHKIEGRIMANLVSVLPRISSEAVNEAMAIFYSTDIDNIDPSADKIHETIDTVLERIQKVNPNLANLINDYDAHNDDSSVDEARYFSIMLLTILTHETTRRK